MLNKLISPIDTMIVCLIQINSLIIYHRNSRHLILFGLGDPTHCRDDEFIRDKNLLKPVLKAYLEPLLTREILKHPSQLLTQISGKYLPYILPQIT